MYKCPECGEIFEEPVFETVCLEELYGVGSMFPNRHYKTLASCPECGEAIDADRDGWDESYEDNDDRIAYYEKQGDEYVYYDENERELYREPA